MPFPRDNANSLEPIVELKHLDFSYQSTPVLQDISLQVNVGEFIGVIGPNGGGKTTLLKLIMGLLKPSAGELHVFGHSPDIHPGHTSRLAYVPQAMRYDREFPISVEEVVLSGLLSRLPWHGCFRKQERMEAAKALDEVGLSDLSQSSFGTLSGGQAQRVLIARALVSKPKLLLLDEPTASVDSQAEAEIYSILSKLKGKMTILMVTHDLRAAIEYVERIFCVRGGIVSLKPEEVCEHFAIGLYHMPLIQLSSNTTLTTP